MIKAEIGIFGGSGFYSMLEKAEEIVVETPYGFPSDKITVGKMGGRKVAFLPRHGKKHQFPPHMIPYRANIWAMKEIGVERILAPCTTGSLQSDIKPGDFVICDQFVDRTIGRKDTFYDGPKAIHISSADPYCPELRAKIIEAARKEDIRAHERGTVVVIQGPRFSSRSESRWFKSQGWGVVNMTQYPEVTLARELEICYANISLVTDFDVWQENPVSADEVVQVFRKNIHIVKRLLTNMIPAIPKHRKCLCARALASATL